MPVKVRIKFVKKHGMVCDRTYIYARDHQLIIATVMEQCIGGGYNG